MLLFSKNIRLRYCEDACFAVNISNNRIVRLNAAAMHILEADIRTGKASMNTAYELSPRVSDYMEKLIQAGIVVEVQDENRGAEGLV